MLGPVASGIVRTHQDHPVPCDECGKPLAARPIFGKGIEYRCTNYGCARCPFKAEAVDTSFSRLGH